ncbi:MAG TPA: methylmalonyl Co-A mutase-associated GTPase MeaB [Myxococcales bacterium]|nr:methylmalonyl Co-A mutase-associated GTPase MeaB [Deltaproteobacteria bacterium]HAA57492.1 methylmalonyl Co-A mutase-associated GTPase MeaB [Myxococcales bacterium]|tara:strand:- start:7681 stop:8646 length:966 start_codon:yes stop_codon:yes gene_type:complete
MSSLASRILKGDRRAVARLIRDIDDRMPSAREELKALYPHTGNAHIIGLTGAPGSGKSSLTDQLIAAFRQRGQTVGVLAVDPSSPFTGGAILGDRIRMQQHTLDKGVFIRSMATRGHLGGLTRSTRDAARVLDAFGVDIILIETVGVGQDEVDIVKQADTTLVIAVPGLGDEVQAIKAGVLEIGDIFVVNKSDLPGARKAKRDLEMMLDLRPRPADAWHPPVLQSIATQSEGIEQILTYTDKHVEHIREHDGHKHKRERLHEEFFVLLKGILHDQLESLLQSPTHSASFFEALEQEAQDPMTLAEQFIERYVSFHHTPNQQ